MGVSTKKILFAAVCAISTFAAAPAFAEDGGEGRAEIRGGIAWGSGEDVAIGGIATGYDWDLGSAFAGFEVSADKVFEDGAGFFLGVQGRVGAKVGEKTKAYAIGGHTWSSCNGCVDAWSGGAGIQHKIGESVYVKAEYRHLFVADFDDANVVVAGVGFAL